MYYLFEESDSLNTPVECFEYDAAKNCFPVKQHWHYFVELIYMLDGSAEMYANGDKFLLSEGDMIVFHPKTVHSICAVDNVMPRYAVLKFDINRMTQTASYAPKFRSIFKTAEKNGMNVFFDSEQTAEYNMGKCFESCIKEMNTQQYGYDLAIQNNIYMLLVSIVRVWTKSGFVVNNETFAEDERYDIFNITEFIDENMTNSIKVSDIAARCNMSYSYFAKQFVSVYGKSCKEYIEMMRIYKAEEYLMFTDFDLNYISQETGFSDCSHLIKSFKHFRGTTPKQFRLQHKNSKQ